MILLIISIIFFLFIMFLVYHLVKYRNPYKLYMVFGKKGSGKTTLMCKLAMKYSKKGYKVYCNSYIPGSYYFDTADLGLVDFGENSVLLVDEVGMIWDNRDFKNFKPHVRDYFKYQRHYKHIVYLFSQSFDVDKKIRDVTDYMYLAYNFLNCFTISRRVKKTITISHADRNTTGESKIVDDYILEPWIFFFLGTVKVTYIPKYVRFFNSFETPLLPLKTFDFMPVKDTDNFYIYVFKCTRDKFLRFLKKISGEFVNVRFKIFKG